MTKKLIASLVGALILFIWQFLSYGPLNIHAKQMDYMPQQDVILQSLSDANVAPGEYFMPRLPLDASMADNEAFQEQHIGKPWATIQYHLSMEYNMGSNLLRGFVVDLMAVFLLVWILTRVAELRMADTILTAIAVGLIGYLTINYLDHIWFEVSSLPDLIDAIVPWTAIGVWLGYWLQRR